MKTMALEPGDLRVESFPTTAVARAAGGEPETWEDILTCAGGCDTGEIGSARCLA